MNFEQLYDRAQQLLANKQHNEAYKILKKLDASIPNHPGILYLLAACQSLGGHKENAIKNYQRVLKLQPNFAEAMNNLGLDLKHLKRYREAIAYFDNALENQPKLLDASLNKASTLLDLQEYKAALDLLHSITTTAPSQPMVLALLGKAHLNTQNPSAALDHFTAARQLAVNNLEITRGYFSALFELNRWETIILESKNTPAEILNDGHIKEALFAARLHTNDWGDPLEPDLSTPPLYALCTTPNPATLLKIASNLSRKNQDTITVPHFSNQDGKIKLGYISTDFRNHPVTILTNNLFGSHNKDQFEVHAVAIDRSPPINNKYRQKIASDCYSFHELGLMSDDEIVSYLRKLKFDVLIDLNGYTLNNRISILASRCAPIQIQYLGFPGTTGAGFIDYTIGDPTLTPASHFEFYSEKIITLPECFQVNDSQRTNSVVNPREYHGLPEGSFVFACFNQNIKFTPHVFDAWLRILLAIPKSVLWLALDNTLQKTNLIKYSQCKGLNPDRLIFAKRIPYDQHLERYAFADLVLDTFPFNGGTTTSDALWMSAPVITMIGDAYSSRMSASLLHGVGLDSLITHSLEEYESLSIELAQDSERLTGLKELLNSNLTNAPVFNTKRFARHLERGLTMAVERSRQSLEPDHILVPQLPA